MPNYRGSTSVIGVVLLVALVVVLGTTISVYAYSVSSNSQRDPGLASFSVTEDGPFGDAEASGEISFVMESGESIEASQLKVMIGGESASQRGANVQFPGSTVDSGEKITVSQNVASDIVGDEDVVLIYKDEGHTKFLAKTTTGTERQFTQYAEFIFTAYAVGTNPGSPWTTSRNPSGGSASMSVSDSKASVGDRSFKAEVSDSTGYTGTGSLSLTLSSIDLSNVETISFDQCQGKDSEVAAKTDGSDQTKSISGSGCWRTVSIDVSGLSGDHSFTINVAEDDAGGSTVIYIDDVQFKRSDGSLVSP